MTGFLLAEKLRALDWLQEPGINAETITRRINKYRAVRPQHKIALPPAEIEMVAVMISSLSPKKKIKTDAN